MEKALDHSWGRLALLLLTHRATIAAKRRSLAGNDSLQPSRNPLQAQIRSSLKERVNDSKPKNGKKPGTATGRDDQ